MWEVLFPSPQGVITPLALLDNGTPSIASPVPSRNVYSGSDVLFNANAAGAPPLSYIWSFDGTNIGSGAGAVLSIPNVQTRNTGTYHVVITNSFGAVTSSPALLTVVNAGPIITSQPAAPRLTREPAQPLP